MSDDQRTIQMGDRVKDADGYTGQVVEVTLAYLIRYPKEGPYSTGSRYELWRESQIEPLDAPNG